MRAFLLLLEIRLNTDICIRVVQKCIANIFLMLDANDPPKKFRNPKK